MTIIIHLLSTATFSSFRFSSDSKKLLYIAEKKSPKNEPFYKQKPKTTKSKKDDENNEEPSRVGILIQHYKKKKKEELSWFLKPFFFCAQGTEFVYKPDWGEQLVGKCNSVIAILNVEEDTIDLLKEVPDDYFPAQVIWGPNGNDVIGTAWKLEKQRLGLYACTNRESCIFWIKESKFRNKKNFFIVYLFE